MSRYAGSPCSGSNSGEDYYYAQRYSSRTATPSPLRKSNHYDGEYLPRPATRGGEFYHRPSYGRDAPFARPPTAHPAQSSPRYSSKGEYATVQVSSGHSRKASWSTPSRDRRSSYIRDRSSTPLESDEDEIIQVHGREYIIPAYGAGGNAHHRRSYCEVDRGFGTDHRFFPTQAASPGYYQPHGDYEPKYYPPPPSRTPQTPRHARHHSAGDYGASINRPFTTRPTSQYKKTPSQPKPQPKKQPHPKRVANEEDAKLNGVPKGYSLKNWDPTEEPILLLGSVFDASSLGKWIYDWTVHRHGASAPMADEAGNLWVLMIQLFGKMKSLIHVVDRVRNDSDKEVIEDFIEGGGRLQQKLRRILKSCEQPMLDAAARQKGSQKGQLGSNAGVEFVDTLFGVERELGRIQNFMAQARLFNLRCDTNCSDIIKNPTK